MEPSDHFQDLFKGLGRQRLKILGVALGPFSRTVKMLGASKVEYILGGGFRVIFIKGSMFHVQELFKRLGASKTEYSGGWLWGHFQKLFKRLRASKVEYSGGWLCDHFQELFKGLGVLRLNILAGDFRAIFKSFFRGLGLQRFNVPPMFKNFLRGLGPHWGIALGAFSGALQEAWGLKD